MPEKSSFTVIALKVIFHIHIIDLLTHPRQNNRGLTMIQPDTKIQLSSGSNVAQSRWMNERGAIEGPHVFFPRGTSERRAIRLIKSVWFAVVLLLFTNKIKNLEPLNENNS